MGLHCAPQEPEVWTSVTHFVLRSANCWSSNLWLSPPRSPELLRGTQPLIRRGWFALSAVAVMARRNLRRCEHAPYRHHTRHANRPALPDTRLPFFTSTSLCEDVPRHTLGSSPRHYEGLASPGYFDHPPGKADLLYSVEAYLTIS